MRIIKNALTVLIIIFSATMIYAQDQPDKNKSESDKKESGWDKISNKASEDFENVLYGKCLSGDCENGFGKREKNIIPNCPETYEGTFKNSKLNGQGTYIKINDKSGIYLDGYAKLEYIGNWEEYKRVGQGVEIKFNKDNKVIYKYDGAWENDKKNGTGKEFIDGVLVYEGKFKNNVHNKEVGCITGDCENSYGVFVFPNKNKYIGEFKDGLKNGFGIETDPKGNYIYGNWKDNKEDGFVRIFNNNNEIMFSGEMLSGRPAQKLSGNGEEFGCIIGTCTDGFAHYAFEDGAKYIGEWKNGIQHGFGATTWAAGNKLVGQYHEGNIHGYGAEYDADGQIIRKGKYGFNAYLGDAHGTEERWNCALGNCGNGFGKLIVDLNSEWKLGYKEYKNEFELKYEGLWVSGLKNGVGFMEDAKGNTYVGQYTEDEYEGNGVANFVNGDMYIGHFEEGRISGVGTMTYADGSKYVGEWSYNEKEGKGKEYDKKGKLVYSGEYYNDERNE